MVVVKPNKKFLYYEDNGDGTCTATISIPEADFFETAVIHLSLDDMFSAVASQMTSEFGQLIQDNVTIVDDSPEGAE